MFKRLELQKDCSAPRVYLLYVFVLVQAISGWGPSFANGALPDGSIVVVSSDTAGLARQLVVIDSATGNRTVLSGGTPLVGSGPEFASPLAIALGDENDVYVSDSSLDAVFRVDIETGNRTIISRSGAGAGDVGSGHVIGDIRSLIFDNYRLIASNSASFQQAILGIDLDTGDRNVISSSTVGAGVFGNAPLDISPGPLDSIYLSINSRILNVDLFTGNRTVVADQSTGAGPELSPGALATLPGGNLVVVDQELEDSLWHVDTHTGNRSLISGTKGELTAGAGIEFSVLTDVVADSVGNIVTVEQALGSPSNRVFRVDPVTGNRTLISGDGIGTGPAIVSSGQMLVIGELSPQVMPGDFNKDGLVDGQDFLDWQRGLSPNPLSAADLSDWQMHYSEVSSAPASAAVPEPAACVLAGLAAFVVLCHQFLPRAAYL